jgi:energy-coupling factor transport system substrate-specific component
LRRLTVTAVYLLSGLIGLVAFSYPFLLPRIDAWRQALDPAADPARLAEAPLLTMLLVALTVVALLLEVQGQAVSAKVVAALGVLVAVASVLRLVETAIPGPGGFSPIFVPIILAGYVFGPRFGFLMGVLTLLTSALITAGVGPWLPFQMLVSGWMGMSAGWLPRPVSRRRQLIMLAVFGAVWGMLYGAALNLYFWPFLIGEAAVAWRPGAGIAETLARYSAFYLATSALWDLIRAAGNAVLIVALGVPTVRALERFRDRFHFEVV